MGEGLCAEIHRHLLDRPVDLDTLLGEAVDGLTERAGADRGTLYLLDHATRTLVSHVAHLPEIAEIRLRLGEGVAGQVARTGKPLRVRSAADDARVAKRFDEMTGYRTRSLMAAPLCSADGHVIAVLELINKRVGEFDREDEANLGECARSLARLMLDTSLGSQLGPGTTQPLAYDPAGAKRLLKEAGFPKGFDMELSAFAPYKEIAEAISGELLKVGI
ncbi:MAG: GAF domain-containing protein, partial [Myxococcota bacterium]|nr:GAF domain-containing protein [Myxococcota bacterium]